MSCLSYEDTWKVIENLLKKNKGTELINHQISSYDMFLDKYVFDIVKEHNPLKFEKKIDENNSQVFEVNFENISYGNPLYKDNNGKMNIMYPKIAHDKNLTYSLPMYIDINMNVKVLKNNQLVDIKSTIFKNEVIGHIPLMKGSKYCSINNGLYDKSTDCDFDKGGYFIIKGNDKVIISQERMADNKPLIFKIKDKKWSHSIEVRSNTNITKMASVIRLLFLSKDGIRGKRTLKVTFSNLKDELPLFVLFKFYGAKTDKEIMEYIVGNSNDTEYIELLKPSFAELTSVMSNNIDAETLIKRKFNNKTLSVEFLTRTKVLPNLKTNKEKLIYLGYLTRKLMNVILGREQVTDRDNFANKRIETAGILMGQLFRKLYKDTLTSFKSTILKEQVVENLELLKGKIVKKTFIENGLNGSLATGNWNAKVGSDNKKCGVAQMLKRLTFSSTISHLRRINAPIGKTGKLVDPRKLHNSQYGYCCVAESPEGHQVGLVKNLALGTLITTYSNPEIVKEMIKDMNVILLEDIEQNKMSIDYTHIFINGKIFGITQEPNKLIKILKKKRRLGKLNYMTSICFKPDENEINIYTDEGRMIRPLFVVKANKVNINKKILEKIRSKNFRVLDLLNQGIIEYLDINESETVMIAQNQKVLTDRKNVDFSHCEIHPSLIFGICASLIPFPEHNQAPRVLYQCAQGKQAIGFPSQDTLNRMDTVNHILHYPQKPIVYTRASDIIGMNDLPAGDNLIVAIATYGAHNIEDSIIVNRGAIERGMFHVTSYKTYRAEEKKDMSALAKELFCVPEKDKCIGIRMGSYDNLDPTTGLVKVGSKVKENDIIIGKMTPIMGKTYESKKNLKYKDTSIQLKQNEAGIVDKVLMTENADEHRLAKIRIRTMKVPEIADKFSSRFGQKGTIGIILDEQDMPFTEDGIVPDIIINPHCMPSRMTVGQFLEGVLGKVGAVKGEYVDGTPFQEIDSNNLDKLLEDLGFHGSGRETLYNGETGDQIETKIYIAPTYYQRLKHMVSDKMHARAFGPTNNLTRQATEGRSRGGGLRLGNMELDCLHAHGMAYYIQDKYIKCADDFQVHLCDNCNIIAHVNEEEGLMNCNSCGNKSDFSKISLPYSSKLLFYEMMGMGVQTKFKV